MKNKKAFTLIEMMVVIAIIIIMSTVLATSVMGYIEKSNVASGKVASQNNNYNTAKVQVNELRGVKSPTGTPTGSPTGVPDPDATFKVTFMDWNGSTLSTQDVASGGAASAPSSPTRTGYSFNGWDKAFNNITSPLTVTAKYSILSYTVTFAYYNGATQVTSDQLVNYGGAASEPTVPVRTNYLFTGWDKDFSNIINNVTVTAKYVVETCTVTFSTPKGITPPVATVDMGKPVPRPTDPKWGNKTVTWYDKDNNIWNFSNNVTSSMTLDARFS